MSDLPGYHPPEHFELFEGCGIRLRPLTGRPYNIAECDGVVKIRLRDAEGREWVAPEAVWFKFETDNVGAVYTGTLLRDWLSHWCCDLPQYAGIEQVMVKAPKGTKDWPGLSRNLVHGHLFAIIPWTLLWGTTPSEYPVREGTNLAAGDNIYYLASRAKG